MNEETVRGPLEHPVGRHTPGPWVVMKRPWAVVVVADNGEALPICDAGRPHVAEEAANAGLIAAAPELLEALQGLLAIVADSRGVTGYHLNGEAAEWSEFSEVDAAESAVAKALGLTPNALLSRPAAPGVGENN
jgi:hypothetical protein